jgi:hypothetical protein
MMKVLFSMLLFFGGIACAQEGRGNLRLVFYNVENLFDPFNDSLTMDEEFLPAGIRHWTWERFLEKERRLYKVLAAAGGWEPPGIIGLCEVENRFVLHWLTSKTPLLKYEYRFIHRDSPDERGIDVALLYLAAKFTPFCWDYIAVEGLTEPTRDILYVKGLVLDLDTLHLFICHWPSRWEGYLESMHERMAAANILRAQLDSIRQENPAARILVVGDFNDELHDPSLSKILGVRPPEDLPRDSILYHTGKCQTGPESAPGTIKYGNTWYEFDHIFASGSLFDDSGLHIRPGGKRIFRSEFLLENDPAYTGKRPIRTYRGYNYCGGFSDHLPVYIDFYRRK